MIENISYIRIKKFIFGLLLWLCTAVDVKNETIYEDCVRQKIISDSITKQTLMPLNSAML